LRAGYQAATARRKAFAIAQGAAAFSRAIIAESPLCHRIQDYFR
jgi:hypothetical protein